MSRKNAKLDILQAAGRVVVRDGISGFTLEAVAAEAGFSKGGLIYHYPSKEALLGAMVEHLISVTDTQIERHQAGDRESAGRWTRGYLASSAPAKTADTQSLDRLTVALLAAAGSDPALLQPLRQHQGSWRRRLADDGIDPVTAAIVCLAADGLWMSELFGISLLKADMRHEVLSRLRAMTRP